MLLVCVAMNNRSNAVYLCMNAVFVRSYEFRLLVCLSSPSILYPCLLLKQFLIPTELSMPDITAIITVMASNRCIDHGCCAVRDKILFQTAQKAGMTGLKTCGATTLNWIEFDWITSSCVRLLSVWQVFVLQGSTFQEGVRWEGPGYKRHVSQSFSKLCL